MSQDPALRGEAEDGATAVVEWGGDDRKRPGRTARTLARWRADRRLAPLVAGVSGLALFGSLLSEWRVWNPADTEFLAQRITDGVARFPAVGAAYLIGLLVLAGCFSLALFGTGGTRRHARLVGLAVTAVLGAVVVMAVAYLDQLGGGIDEILLNSPQDRQDVAVAYGRGIYLALAGLVAAALALYLAAPDRAGTDAVATVGQAAPAGDDVESTTGWEVEQGGDDWPWRPRDARPAAGPVDLTVEPSSPFLPPNDPDTR